MTTNTTPPRTLLDAVVELKPLIEEHADEAERQRRMADEVIEAMKVAGLFQVRLPKRLGGSETPPPDALRMFEAVARIDGSSGIRPLPPGPRRAE